MITIRKIKRKLHKNRLFIAAVFVFFLFIFSSFSALGSEFSDELQHEPYDSIENLDYWYDGIETFYDDHIRTEYELTEPMYWTISGGDESEWLVTDIGIDRQGILKLRNAQEETNGINAEYYFQDAILNREKDLGVSYWLWGGINEWSNIRRVWVDVHLNNSKSFSLKLENEIVDSESITRIKHRINTESYTTQLEGEYSEAKERLYNFEMEADEDGKVFIDFFRDENLQDTQEFFTLSEGEDVALDYLEISLDPEYNAYFDALNIYRKDGGEVGDNKLQIQNTVPKRDSNFDQFTENDYFSMYSSLISKNPSDENNYRTEMMTDNVITDSFVDPERIMRIGGTGEMDNKYKVNQFYFTDLKETYEDYLDKDVPVFEEYKGATEPDVHFGNKTDSYTVDSTESEEFYNATYNFEDPNQLDDWSADQSYDHWSIKDHDGHNNALVGDTGGSGNRLASIDIDPTTTFTVDFWKDMPGSGTIWTYLRNKNNDNLLYIRFHNGYVLIYGDHGEEAEERFTDNPDAWQNVSIQVDQNTNEYVVELNEDEWVKSGFLDDEDDQEVDNIALYVSNIDPGIGRWDAFGFDWIDDYEKGDFLTKYTQDPRVQFDFESKEIPKDKINYTLDTDYSISDDVEINKYIYDYEIEDYVIYFDSVANITPYLNDDNRTKVRIYGEDTNTFSVTLNNFTVNTTHFEDYKPNDQRLEIRVDTQNNQDDVLMNILKWNIKFNHTHGNITWDIAYRESLDTPRWHDEPTNPVFKFSDYLPENETLDTVQINAHFFLTEYDGQKWLHVRTEVCFNDRYDRIYEYDKIIDLGDNNFYDKQDGLSINYIDYFNPNHFPHYEYYNNSDTAPVTYSNLQGFRTLELNSSKMKYNYLDCGFYNLELDIADPDSGGEDGDEKDEDGEDPLPDDVDEKFDWYWSYFSYEWAEDRTEESEFGDEDEFDSQNITTWTENYTFYKVQANEEQFGFQDALVPYVRSGDLPDWNIRIDIGLGEFVLPLNILKMGLVSLLNYAVIFPINMALIPVQVGFYLVVAFLSFILGYLVVGLVGTFLFNTVLFWMWEMGMELLWWIVSFFTWLLWELIEWAFEAVEWFMENVFEDIFRVLMTLAIWIMAFIIWGFTLFQGDFDTILTNTEKMFELITEVFMDDIMVFLNNLPMFLSYIPLILVIAGFCWLKYFYTRARGFKNISDRYYLYFQVLLAPFLWAYAIIIKIKDLLFGWM